jgi:hypothetical protein
MERRLSLHARREVIHHQRQPYHEADQATKHAILDEIPLSFIQGVQRRSLLLRSLGDCTISTCFPRFSSIDSDQCAGYHFIKSLVFDMYLLCCHLLQEKEYHPSHADTLSSGRI